MLLAIISLLTSSREIRLVNMYDEAWEKNCEALWNFLTATESFGLLDWQGSDAIYEAYSGVDLGNG